MISWGSFFGFYFSYNFGRGSLGFKDCCLGLRRGAGMLNLRGNFPYFSTKRESVVIVEFSFIVSCSFFMILKAMLSGRWLSSFFGRLLFC